MDDTPLDLGLRIYRLDGILKVGQPVHTEEQHILHPAILQVIQHPQPELGAFIGSHGDAEYPPVLPDLIVDAVHEYKGVYGAQGPGLPLHALREYLVRDLAHHFRGQLYAIDILELVMDVPGAHAPGIK